MENIKLDATDKKLGRLASQIAMTLMGKDSPDYKPNEVADVTVEVTNADQLDISEDKLKSKTYLSFSGYPSGQKEVTGSQLIDSFGYEELIRRAVYGMLPANKLRTRMMKRLTIK